MNIIHGIPPKLSPTDYCSIDSEWFNINQNTIHRPTSGQFACLTSCFDKENVYIADTEQMALETFKQIQDAIWLIHEAKFDLTHLRRFIPWSLIKHDKLVDTLLMDKILWSGYYDRFGLAHLARRYLNIYLEKELQKSFQGTKMSQEQVEYACRDAMILRQIWDVQKTHIKQDDMYVWKNVDLPMIWAVMNFKSFRIDANRWMQIAQENRAKQKEIDEILPINSRSPKQVLEFLRKNGFKGLEDTLEDTLRKAISKYPDVPAVKTAIQVLESRMYGRRASTYGETWIQNYLEKEDDEVYTIFPNWNIIGAETNRMSCSDPNLQNVPVRETPIYRECFIPRPGNVLLDADWSQQEIGIEAFLAEDKKMIDIFNSGRDIYILVAKELFNQTIEKSDPLRKRMKTIVLGLDYGLSEKGLARKENISEEEARALVRLFRNKFPRIAEYQTEQSKETHMTKTILGHRCYLNPYQYQCPNNALNNPVQGTAAEMMKVSVGQMYANWQFPIEFCGVAPIHDEFIMDCPKEYSQDVAKYMQTYMEDMANWICPGMKFRADVKICEHSWAEKE